MAKNDPATNQELLLSLTFQVSAIINILEKQKITSRDEILDEIRILKQELEDKAGLN